MARNQIMIASGGGGRHDLPQGCAPRRFRGGPLWALVLGMFLLAGTTDLSAEIAPEHYARMQDTAPEYVTIEPAAVRKGVALFSRTRPVRVTALVVAVSRSATGIAVGDSITIRYEQFTPPRGWVGPRPIPILQTGTRYPAYLAWDAKESTFRPAAQGASFESLMVD
jgi:hypothetical protein